MAGKILNWKFEKKSDFSYWFGIKLKNNSRLPLEYLPTI